MRNEIVLNIESEINNLPFKKQLVFAYLACLRTLPNYEYFNREFKFGDPTLLSDALVLIDEYIRGVEADENTINEYIYKVNSVCPLPEKFDSILASSALDCCGCIIETLKFIIDRNSKRIMDVVNLCLDTVDMFLVVILNLDVNDRDVELTIYNHPLMLKEVEIQKGIINYLKSNSDFELNDLNTLLKLQQVNGENVGSIDVTK